MGCGSGMRFSWGLVRGLRGRERGDAKTYFLAGCVHYFKDIRQGSLLSYCVVGPLVGDRDEFVVGVGWGVSGRKGGFSGACR